jgi:hypothetical protein
MKNRKFKNIRVTLTIDLDLIFKVKGQEWHFSCFGVSMTYGLKVINLFVKKCNFQGQ